ncbi:MAG: hypothetical protein ABMA13_01595 [Chthoniobacteraceae bacterium]
MSKKSEPTPPETKAVQINLGDMSLKYLGAIQRAFDLAACTIGSLRCQTEKDYDEFSRALRFMPSQQHHLAFDAVRPAAESWLLRQLLGEALSMLVPLLEDARSVAALATWKASGNTEQARLQEILGPDRQAFLALPFEDKLKTLREKFTIASPNEPSLNSYLKLGQALARGGTVTEADTTEGKDLVVRLMALDLQPATPKPGEAATPGAMTGRVLDVPKSFAIGQKIELKKEEVLSVFGGVSLFITAIMGSLQAFVAKTLPNEGQPAKTSGGILD